MRIGEPRIVGLALVVLVMALLGLTAGVRSVVTTEAECLLRCEEARVECRGSSLLVEPPDRALDSDVCYPAHQACEGDCG